MFIVVIGFTIFRINNIDTLGNILRGMFDFSKLNLLSIYYKNFKLVLSSLYIPIAIICSFPFLNRIIKRLKKNVFFEVIYFSLIFIVYLYSLFLLIQETSKSFIYFNF